jgi:hypothetical protein
MTYKIEKESGNIICPDNSVIAPPYDDQRYLEYAAWVNAGNSPEEISAPFDITVTAYQAKQALAISGMYAAVLAYINASNTPPMVKIKWEYSVFRRQDPDVIAMLSKLGLPDNQADDLFKFAATLPEV